MDTAEEARAIVLEDMTPKEASDLLTKLMSRIPVPLSLMEIEAAEILPRDWEALEAVIEKAEKAEEMYNEGMLDAAGYIKVANTYYIKNNMEKAVSVYQKSISITDTVVARVNLGLTLMAISRFEDARDSFRAAVEKDSEDARVWFFLGMAWEGCQKEDMSLEEALKCYQKALEVDENFEAAVYNHGLILISMDRLEEAEKAINSWLDGHPGSTYGWVWKGLIMRSMGKLEDAITCYDNALKIDPNHELAWLNKATALFAAERFEECLKATETVLEINPRSEIGWNNLGSVLMALGRHRDAVKAFKRALEINPDFHGALMNLNNAMKKLKSEDDDGERPGEQVE